MRFSLILPLLCVTLAVQAQERADGPGVDTLIYLDACLEQVEGMRSEADMSGLTYPEESTKHYALLQLSEQLEAACLDQLANQCGFDLFGPKECMDVIKLDLLARSEAIQMELPDAIEDGFPGMQYTVSLERLRAGNLVDLGCEADVSLYGDYCGARDAAVVFYTARSLERMAAEAASRDENLTEKTK